jgi:hypothetical protein
MGHSLDLEATCNEIEQHVVKDSHLPAVQETNHEPSTVAPVPVPAVAEVVDEPSPSKFSINDNHYDNSDLTIPNPVVGNSKKTGEDDIPISNDNYDNRNAFVLVPRLPVMPTLPPALASAPTNDAIAAVIARVTKKAIEDLSREGKSLAEIEEAARYAAVAYMTNLSRPSSEYYSDKPKAVAPNKLPDDTSEVSSQFSFAYDSYDDTGKKNIQKPRSIFMAKKVRLNPSLRIFVINGHTGKDSRRPITDVGELHLVEIVFIIYYEDICTQYFP